MKKIILVFCIINLFCFSSWGEEIYSKKSDTEVEIRNFETIVNIRNAPTKAVIETISIPLKDLIGQLTTIKARNAQFEAQVLDLRAKYQAEEALIQKRVDEAVKLGIVEEVAKPEIPK